MTNMRWHPFDRSSLQCIEFDCGKILFRGACPVEKTPGMPCVTVAGAFDGLHLGHQRLVRGAVADARAHGVPCIVVSFDPDPQVVLSPGSSPQRLLSCADSAAGLIELGADAVVLFDFTPELAHLSPQDFINRVLLTHLAPVSIHVGTNFRFGYCGAGNVDTLAELGRSSGFEVCAQELYCHAGETVSATHVRELLRTSRLAEANELLGRCHYVRGQVLHGRGEGTGFGFPTANVSCDASVCLPAEGVYACYAIVGERAWPAATNVGAPRSFTNEAMPSFLETNLIGFSGDLYDSDMSLAFVSWLRAPRTFDSLDELKSVVLNNIAWVSDHLGSEEIRLGEQQGEV
ncbi:MAG: riboflavin biosynthesis protein RibF [Coriobacteriales bacterium]|nr:riboflavin biosynthesis protein RibF [Coriobacteriales bacterium]